MPEASFAPAALLNPATTYTLTVGTAAKDRAGNALVSAFTSAFTVERSAPAAAPTLDPLTTPPCGTASLTVGGSAPPFSRVRLEAATLVLDGLADSSGRFQFTVPLTGESGQRTVRVRVVGADGSMSAAAELLLTGDCRGPHVVDATWDKAVNRLTVRFSEPVDPPSVNGSTLAHDLSASAFISVHPRRIFTRLSLSRRAT